MSGRDFGFFLVGSLAWGAFHVVWRITDRAYIPVEFIESFRLFGLKPLIESQSEFRTFYISGLKPNLPITRRTPYGTDKFGLPINNESQADRNLMIKGPYYRIFVLGGSTVMGSGSSTTIGAFLEEALNREDAPTFEVITAGNDGFHSGQELARLSLELLHYAPDMVISFDGVNDLFWSSFLDPLPAQRPSKRKVYKTDSRNRRSYKAAVFRVELARFGFLFR